MTCSCLDCERRGRVLQLAEVIRSWRFRYQDEDALQQGLAAVLEEAGYEPKREVRLDARCRVDLLVGDIAVEVKVAGSAADVKRQCNRYLECPLVEGLVLVTTKPQHRLPAVLAFKPTAVVCLAGAGL